MGSRNEWVERRGGRGMRGIVTRTGGRGSCREEGSVATGKRRKMRDEGLVMGGKERKLMNQNQSIRNASI